MPSHPTTSPGLRRSFASLSLMMLAVLGFPVVRAASALPASSEAPGVSLARTATGEAQIQLVDRMYPASGNPLLRRSALLMALGYFPDEPDTQLRVEVRLALLDWSEGHPRQAHLRLAPLIAHPSPDLAADLISWAELVDGRILAVLGQRAAAQAIFDRLVAGPATPAARRAAAAAADADLRAASDPVRAERWLEAVAARYQIIGPAFEAGLARLLLLNGRGEELSQRLEAMAEVPAGGERLLASVLTAAQEWNVDGDGARLTELVEVVRRLRPSPSPGLQSALDRTRFAANALALQNHLVEVLGRQPMAAWSKGLAADSSTDLESFSAAIEAATRRGEPERSLRLSLRALASHPTDASFPKLVFSSAQFADWVERSRPAAIDPGVADQLLDLCDLLAATNPYYTEGKFLKAARAGRRGNSAGERTALSEVIAVPDQSAGYLAPAYRQLGSNLEKGGEYRKVLEIYGQAEILVSTHRAAAECVLRAMWINLSFGTDHEAERLIQLLSRAPEPLLRSLAAGPQLRELDALVKTGRAREAWAAGRAWWPEWAHLAIGLGAPTNLLEYGVPEIPDTGALEEAIRRAAQSGDFKSYIRDLSILMSAARWQPSLGPEAAALSGGAVKAAGDAGTDLRGLLIRMLAGPHPPEIPGGRERKLCLALNYLDVHQPQESLRVAEEYFGQPQGEDNTTRAMHRIRALAALAASEDYQASAAGLEADLQAKPSDGQRAMSVSLLADLYRRLGCDADAVQLVRQELASPALAGDAEGRATLEAKLRKPATVAVSPPVGRWVDTANLGWYDIAEPRDLRDPRIARNPHLLANLDQVFGPVEQVKYLLLAATDPQLRPEDQNRLFVEAVVRICGWCQTYSQINALTAAVVDDTGFDPQVRLGVLWNTLSLLAREGRPVEFEHWRAHPLSRQLSPDYAARLGLLGREAALDRTAAGAISGLAATAASEPLSPAGVLIERDALESLLRIGALPAATALVNQAATWKFTADAAPSAGTFQVELSRRLRVAEALNPIHEALAAAVLDRFPDSPRDLPAAYGDLRLVPHLPELGADESLQAGLAQVAGRTFERRDLQFWGTLFRSWPPERTSAIDSVVRAGLRAAPDDAVRAQAIVLAFTSFDVDDPQVRTQLEREFAAYRTPADNPSAYLAVRLYEIDRDLRLGRPVKLDEAFGGLTDPRVAVVQARTNLRHATQVGDRAAVRRALDQIDSARLLSPEFLTDALPALALAGTPAELAAARRAGDQLLRGKVLSAWAGEDPAAADAALDLALALGEPSALPAGWLAALDAGPNPLVRGRAHLVQAYLANDWAGVERTAAGLNAQYPHRYSFYWYRALALHHLGRDRDAAGPLQPYLDHAHDELNYPQAEQLATTLGLPRPPGA